MSERWHVNGWVESPNQCAKFTSAIGFGLVTWPSGRMTLEEVRTTAAISELAAAMAYRSDALMRAMEDNLRLSLDDLAARTDQLGLIVRTRHGRQKARRFSSVEWVHPKRLPAMRHVGPRSLVEPQ